MMLNVIVTKLEERLKDLDSELMTIPVGGQMWYFMHGKKKELQSVIDLISTQGGKWYDEYIDSCMIQLH